MKRFYAFLLFWMLLVPVSMGQNAQIDNLKHLLAQARHDTSRVTLLAELSYAYVMYSSDMAMKPAQKALSLARMIGYARGEAQALGAVGYSLFMQGEFPQALDHELTALKIARDLKLRNEEALILSNIGSLYSQVGERKQALIYFPQAKKIYESLLDTPGIARTCNNMTVAYIGLNQLDSARYSNLQTYQLINQKTYQSVKPFQLPLSVLKAGMLRNFGQLQALAGNRSDALNYYRQGIRTTYQDNNLRTRAQIQILMAQLFNELYQPDSSLRYAHLALINSQQAIKSISLPSANLLAKLYKDKGLLDSVIYFLEIAQASNDSLFGPKKFQQLQVLTLTEQQRQQALVREQKEYEDKVRFFALLFVVTVLLLIAFILYRNNRQKQKANAVLESTLSTLKSTQAQLIQKEKLASLGELTAGIAHEIQNPLNFVNNFSELSVELIEELKSPLTPDGGIRDGEKVDMELLADVVQNLEKINLHGKRASSIIKGMLEHSRQSTGERELTDINQLADEYLRLAYHGMKAKNKDRVTAQFDVDYELIADPNLPQIEVIPQDIGRVLLNLINNAFYAVKGVANPTVTLSTETSDNQIIIKLKDNGTGISEATKSKIFQPFFTTKPTGEGTGLGLSLAYDIVTKGHGGTIEVESVEGEGTTFSIKLPIHNN